VIKYHTRWNSMYKFKIDKTYDIDSMVSSEILS
jgi:hypothetical protein